MQEMEMYFVHPAISVVSIMHKFLIQITNNLRYAINHKMQSYASNNWLMPVSPYGECLYLQYVASLLIAHSLTHSHLLLITN